MTRIESINAPNSAPNNDQTAVRNDGTALVHPTLHGTTVLNDQAAASNANGTAWI